VEILGDEGETVTVGQVIARIALNGAGASSPSPPHAAQASEPGAPPTAEPEPGAAPEGNGSAQQASAEAPPRAAPEPGAAPEGNGSAQRAPAQGPPAADAAPAGNVSPVAARAAEVEGVDLARVSGSGPAGRITKSDVLKAATTDGARRAPEADANGSTATAAEPRAETMRGGAAALARYMEESRAIPTATSSRTLTVTVLDARRR